jgi:hypothetical protein
MEAQQLAERFMAKLAEADAEKHRQVGEAADNVDKRLADVEHCKNAMEQNVIPFLKELETHLPPDQFSLAPQIDLKDHRFIGVSFKLGDGPATTISTAFGNIAITQSGDSGSSKGVHFVYAPDAEPFISNSGDLTREKISRLVEMVMDNT